MEGFDVLDDNITIQPIKLNIRSILRSFVYHQHTLCIIKCNIVFFSIVFTRLKH